MMPYTIQMCLIICIFLIFVSVESQTLILSEPERPSSSTICAFSLAAEEDYFVIEGQADLSSAPQRTEWDSLLIDIERKGNSQASFSRFGSLDISKGCSDNQPEIVYCKNNTHDVYNFVVKGTAFVPFSNAQVRAKWTSENFAVIFSDIRRLPNISNAGGLNDTVAFGGEITKLSNESFSYYMTDSTNVEFCVDDNQSLTSVTLSINGLEMIRSNKRCISNNEWCADGNVSMALEYERESGCVLERLYIGIVLADGPFQFTNLVIMMVVSFVCGTIIILLSWTYEKWIVWCPCCGGKSKDITTKPDSEEADSPVEINRLPPLNSPPPASANGTKPKPTATTTSDEDRTKKKRKKNKVTGGESEKKNTEKETPEKETPEERKTPEKKQRKTKKAGESDEGAEQTDQVRPLPSPRMVGEPGFNTSSTSPVNLRSNFSASLAHQGIKSDTRPPSIEVTTRALPKPKKK